MEVERSHRRNMPTSILRVTSVLYIVNLLAFSRTRGFCARGSDKFLPFARWFIAAGRRLLPRRRRDLRCCSSRRRLGPGRAPPGDGRRRASPTPSPISCASSGWENPRVVAVRHPRPSKYHCGRNAVAEMPGTNKKKQENEPKPYPSSTTRNSANRFASASGTRATSRVPSISCSTRSTVPVL